MLGTMGLHFTARIALVSLAASCACREQGLTALRDSLRLPTTIDCGRVRMGQTKRLTIEIDNVGQVTLVDAQWVTEQPFSAEGPGQISPGTSTVVVSCTAVNEGPIDGLLTLSAHGLTWLVPMSFEGVAAPTCPVVDACLDNVWSDEFSRCLVKEKPDGTSCQASDVCLENASCQAGRCTGEQKRCDDHDACTVDVCVPLQGCTHSAKSCPGDGVCHVGSCDSATGCLLVDAPDGQPCGPLRTCLQAQVCVAGQCEARQPPDGFVCAEASPCQGEGHCHAKQCEQPPATTLVAGWAIDLPDAGSSDSFSDLLVSPSGRVTGSSYFMSIPTLGLNEPMPTAIEAGNARRCIAWRNSLVCADSPGSVTAGVSLIDATTGTTEWTYSNVLADLRAFAGPTVQVFLGRLAVLSETQLLALFESRTLTTSGADPRCRRFGMVVIDQHGKAVTSAIIDHPIFDVCTHPHSYGVAVDADGAIYLAFSPSEADNPATALDGTAILSYSSTLALRWVTVEPQLTGGELAVGKGRLFHERSTRVWATATGQPVGSLPVPFGFGVVSTDVVLPSPAPGSTEASAIDLQSLALRWTQSLGGAAGGPVQVGAFHTSFGERNVVLAFTGDADHRVLNATDLSTGLALFSCPIELPERPVQSALTGASALGVGQFTVMSGPVPAAAGWPECDFCDPRWARTRNTFRSFQLPGLRPAEVPWPGAWGGPGHDHQEDAVP